MSLETGLVLIAILVLSAVMHEMAHGYAANALGDPTAKLAGRLTPNPLVHIDAFGSVILPGLLIFSGSPLLFGYAKPVPYNPYNLKGKFGEAFVAGAGALSNVALALILGLVLRFGSEYMSAPFIEVVSLAVYINLLLAVFNLIPIPPLDGSKIFGALLPASLSYKYQRLENRMMAMGPFTGFALVLLVFWAFAPIFYSVISGFFFLIVGVPLQL